MTVLYTYAHKMAGSDCPTGKQQFTREAAEESARAARARGWPMTRYRCRWCECWHLGNPRNNNSKSRGRRRGQR
jgi:hypothetical protein